MYIIRAYMLVALWCGRAILAVAPYAMIALLLQRLWGVAKP